MLKRDFLKKLNAYYKCMIEDNERYGKRIATEEKDVYRVNQGTEFLSIEKFIIV